MNDYQQEFLESQDHIPTLAEICPQSPAPVAYLLLTNMKAMIRCLEHTHHVYFTGYGATRDTLKKGY